MEIFYKMQGWGINAWVWGKVFMRHFRQVPVIKQATQRLECTKMERQKKLQVDGNTIKFGFSLQYQTMQV